MNFKALAEEYLAKTTEAGKPIGWENISRVVELRRIGFTREMALALISSDIGSARYNNKFEKSERDIQELSPPLVTGENGNNLIGINSIVSPMDLDSSDIFKPLQTPEPWIPEKLKGFRYIIQVNPPIGIGGFATVYKVFDQRLGINVAIKTSSKRPFDPEDFTIYIDEAKALAKIESHPNSLRIYDFVVLEEQNLFGIVEEFMDPHEWNTIDKELRNRKTYSQADAIQITEQLCEVVSYYFNFGILHRDLKPANIFIDRSNNIKVTDLGVSNMIRYFEETILDGNSVGTPEYYSPEAAWGDTVTIQSEIFSIAIIFCILLTRDNPFKASPFSSIPEIINSIAYGKHKKLTPPHDIFNKVIDKALENSAGKRYQTPMEFAAALKACISE